MQRCPDDLPDALNGDRKEIQLNRKAHQQIYHDCAARHNAIVTELEARGVKGQ